MADAHAPESAAAAEQEDDILHELRRIAFGSSTSLRTLLAPFPRRV